MSRFVFLNAQVNVALGLIVGGGVGWMGGSTAQAVFAGGIALGFGAVFDILVPPPS